MAMSGTGFRWIRSPEATLVPALDAYEVRAMAAVAALAEYFTAVLEQYAKDHAPWQDRTANARQSLFSVTEAAEDVVTLYLSHGMEYGKWLELCNSGKYSIIMKTLEAHYGSIKSALDGLLRG